MADLTDEGNIPETTFKNSTCRNVEEAIEAAKKVGYENGIMIKASEVSRDCETRRVFCIATVDLHVCRIF
jgi:hypothetical protein